MDLTATTPHFIPSDLPQKLADGLLASGTAVAVFAPDDTVYYASPSFTELYDLPAGKLTFSDLIRHCYHNHTGPKIDTDDIEAWLSAANIKRRSTGNRRFEIDFLDGRWMWASETTFADGWIFLIVTDFTALKRKEFSLRSARDEAVAAAETDYLTGLLNRGAIMKRFSNLLETVQAQSRSLSVALIDLDHFKSINDTFGHDTGDAVLHHFAVCASKSIRENDYIGRVGGEEFLILMPDTSELQACAALERLRYYLKKSPIDEGRISLSYTFSAGIAQWQPGQSLENLYTTADKALYAAKAAGRNRLKSA